MRTARHWNLTLRYGEGLFETLLVRPGRRPVLWAYHRRRMCAAARVLGYPLTAQRIDRAVRRMLSRMDPHRAYRLRIQAVVYGTPEPTRVRLFGEATPLEREPPDWHGIRVTLARFPGLLRSPWKTCSYLWFHAHWRRARRSGWDDALLLNLFGRPFSLTRGNLWVFRDGTWYTPPLREGALAGTFRRFLIEHAHAAGIPVRIAPLHIDDIRHAEALCATNGLRLIIPIRTVHPINDHLAMEPVQTLWERLRTYIR